MAGFGTILRRARRRFEVKSGASKWGRCEECDSRAQLYPFSDDKKQVWMLCSGCSELFVKDEE